MIVKTGPAYREILRLGANMSATTRNWLPWQRPLGNRKTGPIEKIHANTFHLVKKILKIGPVDTEIALLIIKKNKKNKKKLRKVKYIARSASLPSRLKN